MSDTLRYLTDPALAPMYWPAVLAGAALSVMGGLLSVPVVLKKLSFSGQGISHAAFGGVGLAAALGLGGAGAGVGQFAVVLAFCLAAAVLIALVSERGAGGLDTAIGVVLVASMALGAVLLVLAARHAPPGSVRVASWDSILFGSILGVGATEAWIAWGAALFVVGAAWWWRRPLLFWAFDEPAAPAFGVPTRGMRVLLMLLLGVSIVTAIKLAGIVLVSALLVLPGAIALRLSERLGVVLGLSVLAGLIGTGAGLVAAFEMDLPPGPCVVGVLTLGYALSLAAPRTGVRRAGVRV